MKEKRSGLDFINFMAIRVRFPKGSTLPSRVSSVWRRNVACDVSTLAATERDKGKWLGALIIAADAAPRKYK